MELDQPRLSEEEILFFLSRPILLPPNTLEIRHCCPSIQLDLECDDEEATFTMVLEIDGDFRIGHCKECGLGVKSPIKEGGVFRG